MAKNYIVLVGDIVKSGKAKNRQRLQHKLIAACRLINRDFKSVLYAPLKITRGDEIAGVLLDHKPLYQIFERLNDILLPNFIRIALVRGRLTAGLETKDAAIIDGPAFRDADTLLHAAKKKNSLIEINLGNPLFDETITLVFNLVWEIKKRWTPRQRTILTLWAKLGTQAKAAKKAGISQPVVAKTLKRMQWEQVRNAESLTNKLFEAYAEFQ
jgi:hypothetical protein